jgi:CRP-like cAMP-binding protein
MPLPHHSVLQQLPPFARLDEAETNEVLATAASQRYEPGSNVFEQGAEATHFSVLLHGRLRVTQVTPHLLPSPRKHQA